jgi:diphthine synthase
MLILVGVGLSNGDISVRAIDACKKADEIYAENYTSAISKETLDLISKETGKEPRHLEREDLEDNLVALMEKAVKSNIAVVTGGDPLVATTHKIAYIIAKNEGVKIEVIHSSSIISAAMGESGLDFYRFGQICTIPKWSNHYKPVSFYETIARNMANNLHSLLLLDFDQSTQSSINPSYAVDILEKAEEKYGNGLIAKETKIIILHNLSNVRSSKRMLSISGAKSVEFDAGPAVMILPAKLSDMEKEILNAMFGV